MKLLRLSLYSFTLRWPKGTQLWERECLLRQILKLPCNTQEGLMSMCPVSRTRLSLFQGYISSEQFSATPHILSKSVWAHPRKRRYSSDSLSQKDRLQHFFKPTFFSFSSAIYLPKITIQPCVHPTGTFPFFIREGSTCQLILSYWLLRLPKHRHKTSYFRYVSVSPHNFSLFKHGYNSCKSTSREAIQTFHEALEKVSLKQ